jgi:hypothetical protein
MAQGRIPVDAFRAKENRKNPDAQMDVKVDFNKASLAVFGAHPRIDWSLGDTKGIVTVAGTLDNPQLFGTLAVADGCVKLKDIHSLIDKVNLRMTFSGSKVLVEQISAVLGKGTLEGNGSSFQAEIGYDLISGSHLDMNCEAIHLGKNTVSDIHSLGVLNGDAFKLLRGTIDLRRGCQGAKGKEFEDVLLRMNETYIRELKEVDRLHEEGRIFEIVPSIPIRIGRLEKDVEKLGDVYWQGVHDAKEQLPALREYLSAGHPARTV